MSYPTMEYYGKQRILVYDYARILVALLVILGHLYTPSRDNLVRVLIYQFHMPFFFLISGMLYRNYGTVQFKKYINTLLIPTSFFALLFFLISGVFYYCGHFGYKEAVPETLINRTSILTTYGTYLLYSLKSIVNSTAMLNGPCWFLIALFYCKLYVDSFDKNKLVGIILFLVLFILTCVLKKNYVFVGNAMMALPIFYLGYKAKSVLMFLAVKFRIIILFLSVLLIPIFAHYNGTVSMWSLKFGDHSLLSIPCFYFVGILGSLFMLSVSSLFKYGSRTIVSLANSLISIVGLQVVFIFIVDNILGYNLSYFVSMIISITILVLCWVSHLVIQNICPKLVGR